MGYFLRGSIKTDGYSLQLLAYKLCELQSVKYKCYAAELLPDCLTTTTTGMTDYLTKVHNVFKSAANVEHLLGCTPNEMHCVSYLGLDPGQAFVVGAYGLLPQDKTPKIGKQWHHWQQKKHSSHGCHNRGSGKGRKKSICQAQGKWHINLAAKQKAVVQPTLRHRTWMELQKGTDLKLPCSLSTMNTESAAPPMISLPSTSSMEAATTESLSICMIESSLLPLHGATASFADHVESHKANQIHLDKFYNGKKFQFKKYKQMSKKAWAREFHQLADSLLCMVSGTISEKRMEGHKVVIGIGMGCFTSTSRLSSLHGTFESYFIQMVTTGPSIVDGL